MSLFQGVLKFQGVLNKGGFHCTAIMCLTLKHTEIPQLHPLINKHLDIGKVDVHGVPFLECHGILLCVDIIFTLNLSVNEGEGGSWSSVVAPPILSSYTIYITYVLV